MLTLAVGYGLEWLHTDDDNDSDLPKILGKAVSAVGIVETALWVTMIVIAHLIATNSLPSSLQFLKGRIDVSMGFMIAGITSLAIPIITGCVVLPLVMLDNPRTQKMVIGGTLLGTALSITAVVIAHLISTNKLPDFFHDRQVATGLMITGVTLLALTVIAEAGLYFALNTER